MHRDGLGRMTHIDDGLSSVKDGPVTYLVKQGANDFDVAELSGGE
jgi:hypothetical protein